MLTARESRNKLSGIEIAGYASPERTFLEECTMRSYDRRLTALGVTAALLFAANLGAAEQAASKAHKAEAASDSKKAQADVKGKSEGPVAPGEAGMIVVRDRETNELRPAAGNEASEFLKNVVPAANRSDEGLLTVTMPDGHLMRDLKGRFQEYSVVQRDASGKLAPACVSEAPAKTSAAPQPATAGLEEK